jgi:hypothetical protein
MFCVLTLGPQDIASDLVTHPLRLSRSADARARLTKRATVYVSHLAYAMGSFRRLCCLCHVVGILALFSFVHPRCR